MGGRRARGSGACQCAGRGGTWGGTLTKLKSVPLKTGKERLSFAMTLGFGFGQIQTARLASALPRPETPG